MIPIDLLKSELLKLGLEITDEQIKAFDRYAELLVEWNQKMNLTAITEPGEIVIKHFADSAALLSKCEVPQGASLIDVGTGAGFPSIPVKILRPDIEVCLLDAQNKRLDFLKAVAFELGIEAQFVHARAEEASRDVRYRERFDIATARAVANLTVLSELCLPYVKTGGEFLALKGPQPQAEIDAAKAGIKLLGGAIDSVQTVNLSDNSEHTVITVKKISQTPSKYPRQYSKIAKKPLGV